MWIAGSSSVLVAIVAGIAVSQGPVAVDAGGRLLAVVAGPLQLGTVAVTRPLVDAATGQPLRRSALRAVDGAQVALILQTISADKAPGVAFGVYLALPAGATPARSLPHNVGRLGFFNEINHGALKAAPSFRTYDVSDVVRRLATESADAPITVTVAAAGEVDPGAQATIGSVELRVH